MYIEDKDLLSIQEVRHLIQRAKVAQQKLALMSQEQIDTIVKVVAKACYDQRERLAKMAAEETGFGKWQDKVLKNALASKGILEEIKDMRTVGILREDKENKDAIRVINKNLRAAYQKFGVVKYNAFKGMGGNLSFAFAMLDYTNTGYILNSVHSREGCFVYVKVVDRGQTEVLLGAEEKEALEQALGYIERPVQ